MTFKKYNPAYGSILRADNQTYWYTCGAWRLGNIPSAIPGIFAYAPDIEGFPKFENQKTLYLDGSALLKISNQPMENYQSVYLSKVSEMLEGPRYGRIVFLKENRIIEVLDPKSFTDRFVSQLEKEGKIITDLCRFLQLNLDDIGIWGSSLMFHKEPVPRHEIDIVIYGREQCERAFRLLTELTLDRDIFKMDPKLGVCTQFCYRNVPIDLFFDPGVVEPHELDGASIEVMGKLTDETITINDAKDGLFYPPIYTTQNGRRLISFKPAHNRRYFRNGDIIWFKSISLIKVNWSPGKNEIAYGVLDYERAEFLKP